MQTYSIAAIAGSTYMKNAAGPASPTGTDATNNADAPVSPAAVQSTATIVSLSPQARQMAQSAPESTETAQQNESAQAPGSGNLSQEALNTDEQRQVTKLKNRDREVRAHEQAHRSAGGSYTGAPSYTYQTGPDGKRYAVGGEVPINASPVPNNPEATARKMAVIKRAAMAPAQPSGADRAVYAQASRIENQARAEARQQDNANPTGEPRGEDPAETTNATPSPAMPPPYGALSRNALETFEGFPNV